MINTTNIQKKELQIQASQLNNNSEKKRFPVGYNGEQLDTRLKNKFSLNLDYLIINAFLALPDGELNKIENKFFTFKKQAYNTRIFKELYSVELAGKKFATITKNPHSEVISPNLCQIQLENIILYDKSFTIFLAIESLLTAIGADFLGLNRLDIALDFENENTKFFNPSDLVQKIHANKYLIGGRKKAFTVHYETEQGKNTLNGFTLGKRTGERLLRVYNKSLELENNPKAHISEKHEQCQMSGQIWRMEYQLNSKFLASVEGMELRKCFIKEYVLQLFELAHRNFFEMHINQGKSELNKNKEIQTINFRWLKDNIEGINFECIKKKRTILENPISSAKRTVKGNFKEYYRDQNNTLALLNVLKMVQDYGIENFFESKFLYWVAEFDKKSYFNESFDLTGFQKDVLSLNDVEI